jgi:hypothetical protein
MSFSIILYKNTSDSNVVDKTITNALLLYGDLKQSTSIIDPILLIEYKANLFDYNYVYIKEFKRYYFINDIISIRNNLWQLNCTVDTLMSFKTDILNLNCLIARNQYVFNAYINDELLPLQYNHTVTETIIVNGSGANVVFNPKYE